MHDDTEEFSTFLRRIIHGGGYIIINRIYGNELDFIANGCINQFVWKCSEIDSLE